MHHGNLVYVIKQLELGLRPRLFQACARAGLTGAQYTALTVLAQRPGITGAELARRSFVRTQTIASTTEQLVAEGLVRREQHPRRRRCILLYLTEAGARRIERLLPEVNALEDLLVSELSAAERARFAEYLRRCRNTLNAAGHRVESGPDAPGR